MDTFHVVGIAGSIREHSYNRLLLRAAAELLPANFTFEELDIAALPFYDQDVDTAGARESVRRFRQRIAAADGLLIATPEYNYSFSGALKNAIEWASRPVSNPSLRGKPVALMGAATGMFGTVRAQLALRQVFAGTNNPVVNRPEITIPFAEAKFDAQGRLADQATRTIIRQSLLTFADYLQQQRFLAHNQARQPVGA